jgi:hypothetical protein
MLKMNFGLFNNFVKYYSVNKVIPARL